MYRPKDWKPLEVKEHPLHCLVPEQCTNTAYEAGADAILKDLKQAGQYVSGTGLSPYGMVLARTLQVGEKGWFVFIPDEEGQRISRSSGTGTSGL